MIIVTMVCCSVYILYGIYSIHLNVRVVYSRELVLAVTTWSNVYALGTQSLPITAIAATTAVAVMTMTTTTTTTAAFVY